MEPAGGKVRVAILDDYQIVVRGVASMLEPFRDQVSVVELATSVTSITDDVDILLYDTFGQEQGAAVDARELTRGSAGRLVIFSWNLDEDLVKKALEAGASGYLWKGMPAEELVAALLAVRNGETITPPAGSVGSSKGGDWPGRAFGLTARESEVIALITQGLRNQDIAQRACLSINSVKSYIRTAYRKMGVVSRAQAVAWGMRNGFDPDHRRIIHPGDS